MQAARESNLRETPETERKLNLDDIVLDMIGDNKQER